MRTAQVLMLAATLLGASSAQADIVGKVKTIDQAGITLDIGPKLPWGTRVTADQRKAIQQQLPSGSLARIVMTDGKVISARTTSIAPAQVTETSLAALKPYSGGFQFESGHAFWGYVPQQTAVGQNADPTIYKLDGKYDALKFSFCFGASDGSGKLLYRLDGGEPVQIFTPNTALAPVAIDLRGSQTIQVWFEAQRRDINDNFSSSNFLVDHVLMKLPPSVQILSSPASKESVGADEELMWRPAADAIGYRVELECTRLYNTDDAAKQRFFSIQTTAEKRVVKLSDLNLPLGEYRWRVHSLDDVGVMGQMNEWWSFVLARR